MDTTIKYTTHNLIEFEAAMDMDMAVTITLLDKTRNTAILNPKIARSEVLNENVLKNLLLYRRKNNPLTAILDSKYESSCDTILEELKDKYYDSILEIIKPTDILTLANDLSIAKNIIFSDINCHTEKEAESVKRFSNAINPVYDQTSLENVNCLFVKYIDTMIDTYSHFGGKYIYIYNAQFNLGPKYVPKPVCTILGEQNVIRMIDPYKNLTVPNANLEGLLHERSKNTKTESSI